MLPMRQVAQCLPPHRVRRHVASLDAPDVAARQPGGPHDLRGRDIGQAGQDLARELTHVLGPRVCPPPRLRRAKQFGPSRPDAVASRLGELPVEAHGAQRIQRCGAGGREVCGLVGRCDRRARVRASALLAHGRCPARRASADDRAQG